MGAVRMGAVDCARISGAPLWIRGSDHCLGRFWHLHAAPGTSVLGMRGLPRHWPLQNAVVRSTRIV